MTTATSGAGIADSYAGLVGAITNNSESSAGQIADVAISGAGAVVDTVAALADPLNALINAGVGWLLQHVSFLREPLDMLLGNPDAINAQINTLKTAAAQVRTEAQQHGANVAQQTQNWHGNAGAAYKQQMDQLTGELTALGHTLDGTATVVAVSGTLVMTIRSLVYGLISQFISQLIEDALLALASSWFTLGGSIAAFVGETVAKAAEVASKIAGKLSKLVEGLAGSAQNMEKLAKMMETLTKNLGRFSMIAGTSKAVYDAAQPYPTGATA
ncbi:MAG TPA: WXG100 family type VII secretion target [Pseudonocardiaceae bacterium]|nr:WXG100 family type VII secretion target [Pseudonocardiaceae bacterium]